MLLLALTSFVAIANIFISYLAFIRNSTGKPNRRIFILSLVVAVWIFSNYFSNQNLSSYILLLSLNHLVLLAGGFVFVGIAWFLESLSKDIKRSTTYHVLHRIMLVGILTSITPMVVHSVTPTDGSSVVAITFGPLAVFYFIADIFFILRCFYLAHKLTKISQGLNRARMQIIAYGIYTGLGVSIGSSIILPFLFSSFYLSLLGPLLFTFILASLSYAIIRKNMFEVRLQITKAFISALIIGMVVLIYWAAIAIIGSSSKFSAYLSQDVRIIIIFALAIAYWPILQVAHKAGTKVFFGTVYDTRRAVDDISDILISELQEKAIITKTLFTLKKYIASDFIICIPLDDYDAQIRVGKKIDTNLLKNIVKKYRGKPYLRDDLSDSAFDQLLSAAKVEAIVPLKINEQNIIIVVGIRENGRAYSKQDFELVRIVAKNLTLALINSKQYEKILNFSKTLELEVDQATKKLRKSNDELAKANSAKDELLAMATHQMYPQLSAAKGFVEIMLDEVTEGQNKKQLQWIQSGVDRSISIVNDMLSIAQFSSKELITNKQKNNLVKIVNEEIKLLKPVAESESVVLATNIPDKTVYLYVDKNKIKEVVSNILRNAINYSNAGSRVEISVKKSKNTVTVEARDYGIGVKREEINKLFNKNFRTAKAKNKRPEGMGIGLYLAKKVIEAHGGSIYHETPKDGRGGSIFGFILNNKS